MNPILFEARRLRAQHHQAKMSAIYAAVGETVLQGSRTGKVISRDASTVCVQFEDGSHGFVKIPQK
jgi:hypothetical protein